MGGVQGPIMSDLAWVAYLVKHPNLDSGSGHHFRIVRCDFGCCPI